MHDREVVYEMQVSRLRGDVQFCGPGNGLEGGEGGDLGGGEGGEVGGAGVGGGAEEGGGGEVEEEVGGVVVEDWAVVEGWAGRLVSLCCRDGGKGGGGGRRTYYANGQSGLASVWMTSGHVLARMLYAVYAEERMHFPPSAAAARVCQARMSPLASVWKGYMVLGTVWLEGWWLCGG